MSPLWKGCKGDSDISRIICLTCTTQQSLVLAPPLPQNGLEGKGSTLWGRYRETGPETQCLQESHLEEKSASSKLWALLKHFMVLFKRPLFSFYKENP